MKKLNITKEAFEKSQYFKNKYGKLEYVSESGKLFKTDKGKVLMFKESQPESPASASDYDDEELDDSGHDASFYAKGGLYGDIIDKHAEALWDAIETLRDVDEELMEKTGEPLIDEKTFSEIHNCREGLWMELAPYLDNFLYSYD